MNNNYDNAVNFKGSRGGITIVLDETLDFELIIEALENKLTNYTDFFGSTKTTVTFKGRALSMEEERQLLDVIIQSSNLNVTSSKSQRQQISINRENESSPAPSAEQVIVNDAPQISSTPKTKDEAYSVAHESVIIREQMTYYHNGALRSGQFIRYAGSVVVNGDVNPGAEIIAEGNVIVLGSLKGVVHAGCSGNSKCYVSALRLEATQLRISDIITYVSKHDGNSMFKKSKSKLVPEYAYISQDEILIIPLGV